MNESSHHTETSSLDEESWQTVPHKPAARTGQGANSVLPLEPDKVSNAPRLEADRASNVPLPEVGLAKGVQFRGAS